MEKKNKKKNDKQKRIVLNAKSALITSVVSALVISFFGANAFYKIITKIVPSYDITFNKTLFTVTPLLFIGIAIVILFILLVSQVNDD